MYNVYTLIMIPIMYLSMAIVTAIIYRLLKNKGNKTKNILFVILSLCFIVLEISKQISELINGYGLFSIPLHVCSFFVFFPIFASCLKQEWKITKVFWGLSVTSAFIVSVAMIVYPNMIIGLQAEALLKREADYLSIHSIIHHTLIVLYCFTTLTFKVWKPNLKEGLYSACIYALFALLAWIMANILDTNFSGFLTLGKNFWAQFLIFIAHICAFIAGVIALIYSHRIIYKKTQNT